MIDVVIPGLDELLRDSSMIQRLISSSISPSTCAKSENPPVKSLGEILDRGLYHAALESTFRTRNAVEQRETEASQTCANQARALRQRR